MGLKRRFGLDMKSAPFIIIENSGKDAGGIEPGQAAPVDGAIYSHQSCRKHVPDDSIVTYRFITHSSSPFYILAKSIGLRTLIGFSMSTRAKSRPLVPLGALAQ